MSIAATIATNRFGLGARPGELKRASVNPRLWLLQQLDQQESLSFNQDLPSSHDTGMKLTEYRAIKIKKKSARRGKTPIDFDSKIFRAHYKALSADAIGQAARSSHSMNWRLLEFVGWDSDNSAN